MPAATETAAPQAAVKPKTPKKPAEGEAKKQPAKKLVEGGAEKQPAKKSAPSGGEKKRTESGSEKKRTTSGSERKRTESGSEKKRTTPGSERKRTESGSEKKRTTPGSERKRTESGSGKKRTTSGGDKKQTGEKKKTAPATTRKIEDVVDEPAPVPVYVPKLPVALPVLNTLEWASCAKVLENLLNFTPSLGAALANLRPFKSATHLEEEMNLALNGLPPSYIAVILARFNELPLIAKSKLTKEHMCCVGLDKLTEQECAELTPLCAQYREKFGFPFVVCARDAKASDLTMMMKSHLLNDKDQELESGRKQIKKIARLRMLEVVTA